MYEHKGITFPDEKAAKAWEENNRKVAEHITSSRSRPLSPEEWKDECRRVREYGTKRQSRRREGGSPPNSQSLTQNLSQERKESTDSTYGEVLFFSGTPLALLIHI